MPRRLIYFKDIVFEIGGAAGGFHTHKGEECGIILERRREVIHGDETCTLETGDSIYLDSSKPHAARNIIMEERLQFGLTALHRVNHIFNVQFLSSGL